jgi:hypothetical protein
LYSVPTHDRKPIITTDNIKHTHQHVQLGKSFCNQVMNREKPGQQSDIPSPQTSIHMQQRIHAIPTSCPIPRRVGTTVCSLGTNKRVISVRGSWHARENTSGFCVSTHRGIPNYELLCAQCVPQH